MAIRIICKADCRAVHGLFEHGRECKAVTERKEMLGSELMMPGMIFAGGGDGTSACGRQQGSLLPCHGQQGP
jgi:hypothetical protein